ncbi:MAG: hypothetical protein M0Z36_09155 [Thermaerobacter sp.]|nr:hypothetical protein [Thermaerobacter sp.]
MTKHQTFFLLMSSIAVLGLATGASLSSGTGTSTPATDVAIQHVLEQAISMSIQVIPTTVVPLGHVPSSSAMAPLLSSETAAANHVFTPTDPYLQKIPIYYQNALNMVGSARNDSNTFTSFHFTSTVFNQTDTKATVAFTAQSTTLSQVRTGDTFTGPWRAHQLPGAWTGSATLQYSHGHWFIATLTLNDSAAG